MNISSGLTRFADPDQIAYAMSKRAVEMLALHFAKLLGPRNITISTVVPGITLQTWSSTSRVTFLHLQPVGEPEDVADVIAFLVSDAAGYRVRSSTRAAAPCSADPRPPLPALSRLRLCLPAGAAGS
ncbi:hypothetical protein SMICM304S_08070 [Streptomyces microflavus]